MTITESLKTWFRQCPLIDKADRFNVNYLGAEPMAYSIDDVPGAPFAVEYLDGNGIQMKNFVMSSRDSYGRDILQNIASSGFWDELLQWVTSQNNIMSFPDLGEGVTVLKISATSSGYIIENDEDTARWQMQLQILFYRKE